MDTPDYKQQDELVETEEYAQQITFSIDNEEYGVDALRVQEIIRYLTPVKVPNAPESIQGVINFRGEVIPVVDLRKTFGLNPLEIDQYTVIVILETEGKIFGIVVDRILDMVNIPLSKINDSSVGNSQANRKYLKAMIKFDNRLILILDLEKILNFDIEDL
ncbi:MAG: chemotaxis protein CheW [Bacteroidota bacterium]